MKRLTLILFTVLVMIFGVSAASAADIGLSEWILNINGIGTYSYYGDPMPAGVNVAGFNDLTGLGTITIQLSGLTGAQYVGGFFDHEIMDLNNPYDNEFGSAIGSPAAGQSWEIDEPEWVFGDIVTNLTSGALDNSNGVPEISDDDVSMALGWDFVLALDEQATITLLLSTIAPSSGFYLQHADSDSCESIFFSSTLDIGPSNPVPIPSAMLLLGSGLAGLAGLRKKYAKTSV